MKTWDPGDFCLTIFHFILCSIGNTASLDIYWSLDTKGFRPVWTSPLCLLLQYLSTLETLWNLWHLPSSAFPHYSDNYCLWGFFPFIVLRVQLLWQIFFGTGWCLPKLLWGMDLRKRCRQAYCVIVLTFLFHNTSLKSHVHHLGQFVFLHSGSPSAFSWGCSCH